MKFEYYDLMRKNGHEIAAFIDVEVEANKKPKVLRRCYLIYEPNSRSDYSAAIGTPSKVNGIFKKLGITFDSKEKDKEAIQKAIGKFQTDSFNSRKAEFQSKLKDLIKEYKINLVLACNGGGWGEAWGNAELILKDTQSKANESLCCAKEFGTEIIIK